MAARLYSFQIIIVDQKEPSEPYEIIFYDSTKDNYAAAYHDAVDHALSELTKWDFYKYIESINFLR